MIKEDVARNTERQRARMKIPVDAACHEKWLLGRVRYGPEFVGEPVPHLHDELLDAINYVEEARRQFGDQPGFAWIEQELLKVIAEVRLIDGKLP